jgi:hypothetical protein
LDLEFGIPVSRFPFPVSRCIIDRHCEARVSRVEAIPCKNDPAFHPAMPLDPAATFSLDRKGGAKRSRLQRSGEKCPAQPKEKQVRAVVQIHAAVGLTSKE